MARKQRSERAGRLKQIRTAYQMTRQVDRMVLPIVLLVGLGTFAVFLAVGFVIGQPIYLTILGVLFGLLASTIVFGRRAEKAAYSQVEGKPGAAAAVLNGIRRGWTVTPAVVASHNKDGSVNVVHRAVGRPGIVLIAEGSPSRLTSLLAAEKRKMARIAGEAPGWVEAHIRTDDLPLGRFLAARQAEGSGATALHARRTARRSGTR